MASIFSKIVAGEIPCFKVAENDEFLAFLDIMPLREGHTLVIPKKETDYIFDIADDELGRMMMFAKKVAAGIKANIQCKRIGVTVIGLEVPHAHIHLIPLDNVDDINFSKPKLTLPKEDMAALAIKISEAIIS
jgi:histidine triad (HIT) family protein